MDLSVAIGLGWVVAVGSLVQSSLGFGVAVVAAPAVVLVDPGLMPVSMVICGFVLPLFHLVRGPRDIDLRVLGWAFAGRLALTPLGVLLVVMLSPSAIAATVGVLVLVTVALSLTSIEMRATPRTALGAGLLTGVSGTAAAIGGPFLALVLQHEAPVRVRSTLAAFFVGGSATTLIALALGGEVHRDQVVTGLIWIPFLLLGHALAGPLRDRLDGPRLRRGVLVLSAVASLSVIARSVGT